MRPTSLVIAALAFLLPASASADPTGKFDVRGINPDNGGEYTGTVRVTRTGATYKVVWKLANGEISGVGVGIKLVNGQVVMGPASEDDVGISVAYGSDGAVGTVVYFEQPDGRWHGVWAYEGWDRISTEDWFPMDRKTMVKLETKAEKEVKSFDPQPELTAPKPTAIGPKS